MESTISDVVCSTNDKWQVMTTTGDNYVIDKKTFKLFNGGDNKAFHYAKTAIHLLLYRGSQFECLDEHTGSYLIDIYGANGLSVSDITSSLGNTTKIVRCDEDVQKLLIENRKNQVEVSLDLGIFMDSARYSRELSMSNVITHFDIKVRSKALSSVCGGIDVKKLKENPFCLVWLGATTDFAKVDEYAKHSNVCVHVRYTALSLWTIRTRLEATGDSYISYREYDMLIKAYMNNYCNDFANIHKESFESAFKNIEGVKVVMVNDSMLISTNKIYLQDTTIHDYLKTTNEIQCNDDSCYVEMLENLLKKYEIKNAASKISHTKLQRQIIQHAFQYDPLIINGRPGTGKTTLINGIVALAEMLNIRVCLLAPTGKSAKVMAKKTGKPAYTIHRFLYWADAKKRSEVVTGGSSTVVLPPEPEDIDMYIVDEMSMVGTPMLYNLVTIIKEHDCKFVMVGDIDQLPPIDRGSPFKDIYNEGQEIVACHHMKKIHRQDDGEYSNIILLAKTVIENNELENSMFTKDVALISSKSEKRDALQNLISSYDLTPGATQVLIPTKQGPMGTTEINAFLRSIWNNQQGAKKKLIERVNKFVNYRIGDKIIFTKNVGVLCNGDIGYIEDINVTKQGRKKSKLAETWDIRLEDTNEAIVIDPEDYMFDLGYAVTVHKSQGSEYDNVILILDDTCANVLLKRKLLYTAITRAKKKLFIIGKKEIIQKCIKNNSNETCKSFLRLRLQNVKC